MSLDNLTGENRNNLMVQTRRRCSFCRTQGHNISSCNDNRLTNFESECRIEKQHCEFSINPRIMFRNWLCDKSILFPHIVRTFAVRKCGSLMRHTINVCIDNIVQYIYQDMNESIDIIPTPNDNGFGNLMRSINYVIFTRDRNNILEADILLGFRNYIFQNETSLQRDTKFAFVSKLEETPDTKEFCDCAICYEDDIKNINFIKLNCSHKFCNVCLKKMCQHKQNNGIPCCPLCRSDITVLTFKDKNIQNDFCNAICESEEEEQLLLYL